MNALLSNLLAGLLCIHAVLGCCWHHEHARAKTSQCAACSCKGSRGTSTTSPLGLAGAHRHCGHHQRHNAGGQQDSNEGCPCEMRCAGTCQFVSTKKVEMDSPIWTLARFEADALLAAGLQVADSRLDRRSALDPVIQREPSRLYLLHQLLLI